MDPEILNDYAIVGGEYIFNLGNDFNQWSQKMIAEFGEELRPFLDEIFIASTDYLETEINKAVREELEIAKNPRNIGRPITIISGGQTGADKAGVDFAIYNNIPHKGWCPKGRKAEDGKISSQYQLQETPSADYLQRTEWNVRDSDGTVIFTMCKELTGGSKRTAEFASMHGKPLLHIYPGKSYQLPGELLDFVTRNNLQTLNVAGTRGSKEPEVYRFALELLKAAFASTPSGWIGGQGEG